MKTDTNEISEGALVSPGDVLKETIQFAWQHKGAYVVFSLGSLLLLFASVAVETLFGGWVFAIPAIPLFAFSGLAFQLGLLHYTMTGLRGSPRLYPKHAIGIGGQLFGAFLMVGILGGLVGFVTVGPMSFIAEGMSQKGGVLAVVGLLLNYAAVLVVQLMCIRWALSFPATVIQDKCDVFHAWNISKGHAPRMFFTYIVCMVPPFVAGLIATLLSSLAVDTAGIVEGVMLAVVKSFCFVLGSIALCVWYEKLRLRPLHQAIPETSEGIE